MNILTKIRSEIRQWFYLAQDRCIDCGDELDAGAIYYDKIKCPDCEKKEVCKYCGGDVNTRNDPKYCEDCGRKNA
jgi:hypothetical protein